MTRTNWAGNVTFHEAAFHEPTSIDELQHLVAASTRCRILGTGHSFSTVADTTGDLISLAQLPTRIDIDAAASTVTVSPGIRYGELAPVLHRAGFGLHNTGSLPHISVAGACSTGTHGSGDTNGCMATAVTALDIVSAAGDLVHLSRANNPDEFVGAVIAMGSIGVVSALTLSIEPTYDVRQVLYDDVPFDTAVDELDRIMSADYSVSLFTTWTAPVIEQVWRKQRSASAAPTDDEWFGGRRATEARHPVPGMDATVCTQQLGVDGPWFERLPHFRLDFTPSAGDELQTEYLVDRRSAPDALRALDAIRLEIAPVLFITEIRSIAADDLWLSPAFGRESIAIHFTWKPDAAAVAPVIRSVEAALAPFAPRPHWGKVFSYDAAFVRAQYPRFNDAVALAERYDPSAKFINEFTQTYLRG